MRTLHPRARLEIARRRCPEPLRRPTISALLLAPAAFLCACAAPPPPAAAPAPPPSAAAPAPAPAPAAVETADTPYTADEIRDACPAGRKIVFRVVEKDRPEVRRVVEFVKSDAGGADVRITETDPSGKVLKTSESRSTWEELRSHAAFPKDRTTITHRMTVSPLGTLDVFVYKVKTDDDEVTTYHFAKKLPGPPVTHFTDRGGARVLTSTMESSSAPK